MSINDGGFLQDIAKKLQVEELLCFLIGSRWAQFDGFDEHT